MENGGGGGKDRILYIPFIGGGRKREKRKEGEVRAGRSITAPEFFAWRREKKKEISLIERPPMPKESF